MTDVKSQPHFTGIIPPMVTPLLDQDTLDVAGLERLVEHILAGGVHGLFILGTTGEGPSLSDHLRREMIERVCRQVADRVPVLVGITDTSYADSLALSRYAEQCGASAAVVAPPYYFPINQSELLTCCRCVVDNMALPVVLYNMPACTKVRFEMDTLRHLLDHPRIVAFKDSSGDLLYFRRSLPLFEQHPDKTILIGPEELLGEATLMGGHGGVSGGANLFPRLYVELYDAAVNRDVAAVQRLHEQVMSISSRLYTVDGGNSSALKSIKAALECLGLCSGLPAWPFERFNERDRRFIDSRLGSLREQMHDLQFCA